MSGTAVQTRAGVPAPPKSAPKFARRPYTSFSFGVTYEMLDYLTARAAREQLSVGKMIVRIIQEEIDREEKANA